MPQSLRRPGRQVTVIDHGQSETLRNCLRIAAERFDENAKQFADYQAAYDAGDDAYKAEVDSSMMHSRIYRPLQRQFEGQAEEARELIAILCDGPEDIDTACGDFWLETVYVPAE